MNLHDILQFLAGLFYIKESPATFPSSDEEMLHEAHQDLLYAENLFAQAEDPAMIDYTIFYLKAAEERYNYLIKLMKIKAKESKEPIRSLLN